VYFRGIYEQEYTSLENLINLNKRNKTMSSNNYVPYSAEVMGGCRARVRPGVCSVLPSVFREPSYVPNLKNTKVQFLVTPDLGAGFTVCELFIGPDGGTEKPNTDEFEHFLFVLEGELDLNFNDKMHNMVNGGYVWLPPKTQFTFKNITKSTTRAVWWRRSYKVVEGLNVPEPIVKNGKDVPAVAEDTNMAQYLIPFEENRAFDMGISLLNFAPSVCFSRAEAHVFEHGIYFLQGRGTFWINGESFEVREGDFVYIAPFIPHLVCCFGEDTLRYLLYKDVNRDIAEGI